MSIKNIITPDLGGATDVSVIEILVKPGDKIEKEATIVTLESDKATLEVPTTDSGTVKSINVKVGDKVSTGSLLLVIESVDEKMSAKPLVGSTAAQAASFEKPAKKHPLDEAKKSTHETIAKQEPLAQIQSQSKSQETPKILEGIVQQQHVEVHAGPGVRRLARELGVNLSLVQGSGPKSRIIKEDVQGFVKNQLANLQTQAAPFSFPMMPTVDFSKFGAVETRALSRIKKISGKHLQRNWMMIPHVTQFAAADITALEDFRQSQKVDLEKQKIKLTPLVFVMKAVVASLKVFPEFNASLDSSGEQLILKKYFHIGVAVDTPDGLVVPVIRDVDKKGLVDLAKELALMSEKARNKQLTPQEMQGGCFSISSLGGIGGTAFTPIINHPEVAILGVSKSSYQPVYQEGEFVPRLMLPLSLSYDHRVIDGAEGARFITHLTQMLSDIRNLLL